MSLIYEARNLRKYYGRHLALLLPCLNLEKGAALVLIGQNGSGKSTLLRLLAFIEKPTSGTLNYFGGPEPCRECTLLLQEPWLLNATVFENVTLGLKLRGKHGGLKESFCEAMQACGFEQPWDFAERRRNGLSGGEKQRVALASRLAINPCVLLLDEPTAYVDSKSAVCILDALLQARNTGLTIICATHDASLASALQADVLELHRPE